VGCQILNRNPKGIPRFNIGQVRQRWTGIKFI